MGKGIFVTKEVLYVYHVPCAVVVPSGCPAPAAQSGIALGGRDALVLTYPDCPAGQNLYHLWTVTVVGGLAYQFVWFNHPGNEAQDRAVLDEMLRSLTFTK